MKKYFLIGLFLMIFGAYSAYAATDGRWGVEFVPGNASIGGMYLTSAWEAGSWLSVINNDAAAKTELTTIGFWGGLRNKVEEGLYFVYGLDCNFSFGKTSGSKYDSNYNVGPYISLEKELTKQVSLCVWTEPIAYSYSKVENTAVTTVTYFKTLLSIQYFF